MGQNSIFWKMCYYKSQSCQIPLIFFPRKLVLFYYVFRGLTTKEKKTKLVGNTCVLYLIFDWIWFWVSRACLRPIFRLEKSGWIYLAINKTIITIDFISAQNKYDLLGLLSNRMSNCNLCQRSWNLWPLWYQFGFHSFLNL